MSEIPKQKRSWNRIVLPASILLNLFLLAAIGGHLVHVRNRDRKSVV